MNNLKDVYRQIKNKIEDTTPKAFFVKTETAEVIQKFIEDIILKEYRETKEFNSYLDLCFGSGNLSIHILEALGFYEDNQAKIREGKTVIFNDKHDIANWDLEKEVENITFIRKDVFTADFFEDPNITESKDLNTNEEPDNLSMFITYLKHRNEIIEGVKSFNEDFELEYSDLEITLKEKGKKKGKINLLETEVLQHLLGKNPLLQENTVKKELLDKITEETKNKVEKRYIPKQFDFITANFLITSSEDKTVGSIKLDDYKKLILSVIFEYFLSPDGVFLFVGKASSDNDFKNLKSIFGEKADYITVFNVPEMNNDINFILKPNLKQSLESGKDE